MFPKTFQDGNLEDRAYVEDFWSWLRTQPQDAWLLWARGANWDNADLVFEEMLDDPACDLALVSWLFWKSGPAHVIAGADGDLASRIIGTIVANVSAGYYGSSNLFLDRYEVVHEAHSFLEAVRTPGNEPPLVLPRILCGPFEGRRARLPDRYDEQTEQGLREVLELLGDSLPRNEDEYWRDQREGGNLWVIDKFVLPQVPTDPVRTFSHLDDAAFLEAIFGTAEEYKAAIAPAKKRWWPFG